MLLGAAADPEALVGDDGLDGRRAGDGLAGALGEAPARSGGEQVLAVRRQGTAGGARSGTGLSRAQGSQPIGSLRAVRRELRSGRVVVAVFGVDVGVATG